MHPAGRRRVSNNISRSVVARPFIEEPMSRDDSYVPLQRVEYSVFFPGRRGSRRSKCYSFKKPTASLYAKDVRERYRQQKEVSRERRT